MPATCVAGIVLNTPDCGSSYSVWQSRVLLAFNEGQKLFVTVRPYVRGGM